MFLNLCSIIFYFPLLYLFNVHLFLLLLLEFLYYYFIFCRQGRNIVVTSKYAHFCHTSRPPADVTLPFLGYRCGGFDSCVCLLSRQENHRTEVKKHVLPNVSFLLNSVSGKSFEAILPVWVAYGEEFKKCVETTVAQRARERKL